MANGRQFLYFEPYFSTCSEVVTVVAEMNVGMEYINNK